MKIAVLGAGRMGSWFIRELSRNHDVVIFDTSRNQTDRIPNVVQLEAYADLAPFHPELLLNAVSLSQTINAFHSALPFLPPDCLLADIASVKGAIPEFYRTCGFRFVSVHPMFGPTFADLDDLARESVLLIKESDPAGLVFFREYFGRRGLRLEEASFEEHDRMMAYSLALPFTSTMVFASCLTDRLVPGTTFKKHLGIARGLLAEDDALLAEVIFNPQALVQIEFITNRLEFLKHIIRQRDTEVAVKFFDQLRARLRLQENVETPGKPR